MPTNQIPAVILPTVAPTGYEVENVTDALVHYSNPVPVRTLQEKVIQVYATEFVTAAGPGNISMWLEVAPYDRGTLLTFGTYVPYMVMANPLNVGWTRLGGITVLVPAVVTMTRHDAILAWTSHSWFARLAVQALAAIPTDFWMVTAIVSGKGVS